ncbi:diphosphomevalonate decarboxylase [Isoptericola jiangsuensis]|uniref:diphosphomevalonate decarboxylase n=1 Tax=Isoptericola jiangsuensis TaxID=548579 RepID=A0A2A9EXU7_9MICO|nr:diphosphomevalonate decarboxylase [Isoptericola jiangsuensis]PFG43331.1 diphosphomevalonate decarboxylase [Isoptericola jiangsuensis]
MTAATARAYPNIALVKYWGKQDAALNLPATGSLSLTLDVFPTTTTVELVDGPEDAFSLNGAVATGTPAARVFAFLDLVRERAGSTARARVESVNAGPTGAGLASSASGFAALAAAASAAYGLPLDTASLSRLARRGSGSAARSILPGVSVWHAGDDASSYAEPVEAPELAMVVATVDGGPKAVSSREAMNRTAATSPYYDGWVTSTRETLDEMLAAARRGDYTRMGELTELSALRMHASIQACDPPVRYLVPASVALFDRVAALRAEGVEAYATADAGPNVVALCRPADREAVAAALRDSGLAGEVTVAGSGPGVEVSQAEPAGAAS